MFTMLIVNLISTAGFIFAERALLILPTLIDVGAVLLGFWGLLLIYGLTSLRSEKRESLSGF